MAFPVFVRFSGPPKIDVRVERMTSARTAHVSETNRFRIDSRCRTDRVDVFKEWPVLNAQNAVFCCCHLFSFLSSAFGKVERDGSKKRPLPSVLTSGSWNCLVGNTERGSRAAARSFLHRVVQRIFPRFDVNDFYAESRCCGGAVLGGGVSCWAGW